MGPLEALRIPFDHDEILPQGQQLLHHLLPHSPTPTHDDVALQAL